ncbi:hypothetical protein [Nocardioides sp. MH1]|uniref:hypothetical protein n=1 Tax=Nocardioides sp. MH1 TaxID=3242490 RepID=UPI0035203153
MSDNQYIVWFIGMAFLIAMILGLGTLTMAGVLRRHPAKGAEAEVEAHPRHAREEEHHHWYDRFHHAA